MFDEVLNISGMAGSIGDDHSEYASKSSIRINADGNNVIGCFTVLQEKGSTTCGRLVL
jgi:hypothetical protein